MNLVGSFVSRITKNALGAAALETGINAAFAASDYVDSRNQGHGGLYSGLKALGDVALYNTFALPMIALSVAPLAPLALQAVRNKEAVEQRNMLPFSPYRYTDTEYAQTSRQRALAAIQDSRMNARSAIGNEAGLWATRYR